MPYINLLPWREELRARKQKQFGVTALIAALAMAGVVFGVHLHMQDRIDFQNQRNQFLEDEIGKLDKQIQEIKDLEKQRERLLARSRKIEQLQNGRPDIVHLMDAFVEKVPDGVYFTQVVQVGTAITIDGIAQSNGRVSSLMRQLESSDWLGRATLRFIRRVEDPSNPAAVPVSQFQLIITQNVTQPLTQEEDA